MLSGGITAPAATPAALAGRNTGYTRTSPAAFAATARAAARAAASRAGEELTVKFKLTKLSGQQLMGAMMATMVGGEPAFYGPQPNQIGNQLTAQVPAGTYDVLIVAQEDNGRSLIIYTIKDLAVTASADVAVDITSLPHTTECRIIDSDGELLQMPAEYGADDANAFRGQMATFVSYRDCGIVTYISADMFTRTFDTVKTNAEPDGPFGFVRNDFRATPKGMVLATYRHDFTKAVNGTTADAWQHSSQTFQPTQTYLIKQALEEEYKSDPTYEYYDFFLFHVLIGNDFQTGWGSGIFVNKPEKICNTGAVSIWQGDDCDGISLAGYPEGSTFGGDQSALVARPVRRGPDGMIAVGGLSAFQIDMMSDGTHAGYSDGPALYQGAPTTDILGNCTPIYVTAPYQQAGPGNFKYEALGRNGEAMTTYSWNMAESVDPDYMPLFGGHTNSVEITLDGTPICTDRALHPYQVDWDHGLYHAVIKTLNLKIDGNLDASNTTVLDYDTRKGNGSAPTLTSLQLRNAATGAVTDRFDCAADGIFYLSALDPKMEIYEARLQAYYITDPIASVKAEYAPAGTGQWAALDVAATPEHDSMPGYGYFYRGTLDGVTAPSATGWYDLRITVTDTDGSTQTQTLSPAFHAATPASVTDITATDAAAVSVSGRSITAPAGSRIYTPAGTPAPARDLAPGVYIVRTPRGHTVKAVVK